MTSIFLYDFIVGGCLATMALVAIGWVMEKKDRRKRQSKWTSFDPSEYYRVRVNESVAVTEKAIVALTAKGMTADEITTIIERAEKKTRKEYGL